MHNELPQRVCVVGAGGHGKVVIRCLQAAGCVVEAVFDDDPDKWGQTILGRPIVGPVADLDSFSDRPTVLALGINRLRQEIATRYDREWQTVIHPSAILDDTVEVGPGSIVLAGAVVQCDARIGAHVIVNTASVIEHDCRVGDYAHIAPRACLLGGAGIAIGGFVGAGATVLPGITTGEWTTIGAGAVVVKNLDSHVTVTGVPARVRVNHQT